MFKREILLVLLLGCSFAQVYGQENGEIIFSGVPVKKISEGGTNRIVEDLKGEKALAVKCAITKIGDKYLWQTRNNVELILIQSGAFLTFVATSGAGYVRIIPPNLKNAAAVLDETEKKFDYLEHMLIGLKSVTYYGKSK